MGLANSLALKLAGSYGVKEVHPTKNKNKIFPP
jgi:hypothetical protein